MFTTTCKECIWAEYNGNKQTDCALGRLESYNKRGAEITLEKDDEKEYFLVHERICHALRRHDWAKNNEGADLVELVNKESEITVDALIYFGKHTTEELCDTLMSVCGQSLPFSSVRIIVDNQNESLVEEILLLIQSEFGELKSWTVDHMAEKCGELQAMNLVVNKCNNFVFSFAQAGFCFEKDFNRAVDNYVKDCYQFFAICPRDDFWNGFVVPTAIFKYFDGHSLDVNYLDKSRKIAVAGGHSPVELVPTWEKVWSIQYGR